jgi:predicted transcriptional regulator
MKSVLISIKPKWVDKSIIGEKTIEVRKTSPKEVPFKCYIYMSQGDLKDLGSYSEWIYKNRMRVIGEFICDKVYKIEPIFSFYYCYSGYDDSSDCSYFEDYSIDNERLKKTCLTQQDLCVYGNGKTLYGWHISDLKIYDKPLSLSKLGVTCPPQSWKYVEELENEQRTAD